jgi:hypothetical protein
MILNRNMKPKVKLTFEEYELFSYYLSKLKTAETKIEVETFYQQAKNVVEIARSRRLKKNK